jgi:hypothetical protein
MIWGKTKAELRIPKESVWFAWYPVQLKNGKYCWLQYIKKITTWSGIFWNDYYELEEK